MLRASSSRGEGMVAAVREALLAEDSPRALESIARADKANVREATSARLALARCATASFACGALTMSRSAWPPRFMHRLGATVETFVEIGGEIGGAMARLNAANEAMRAAFSMLTARARVPAPTLQITNPTQSE